MITTTKSIKKCSFHGKRFCEEKKFSDKKMKDQYYTKQEVISACLTKSIPFINELNSVTSCLDFSAGNNRFNECMKTQFPLIQHYHAYDIDPKKDGVLKQDFLTLDPFHVDIIGFNPPFGFKSTLVKSFLDHAAKFTPLIFLLILPFCNNYIYPPKYEEVYNEKINDNSFFNPNTLKTMPVRNCYFCVLKYNTSFVYKKPIKESEILFSEMKRFPPNRDGSWWPNFTQGFAVRNSGSNVGKHVIIWNGESGILIDEQHNQTKINSFVNKKGDDISSISFFTYQTNKPVSVEFAFKILDELKSNKSYFTCGVFTSLNTVSLSKCIANVIQFF